MLLAVSAKRSTLTSSASSGSAAASGSCVSMILHCCRSLRATRRSVDFIFSIPAVSLPRSLLLPMTVLQQPSRLKQRSVLPGLRSRAGAEAAFAMEIAKLAFENLATGLTRQRVEELDVLWNLEVCQTPAQKILHRGRRQHRVRFRLDTGK